MDGAGEVAILLRRTSEKADDASLSAAACRSQERGGNPASGCCMVDAGPGAGHGRGCPQTAP
jgi:hypothetical protein